MGNEKPVPISWFPTQVFFLLKTKDLMGKILTNTIYKLRICSLYHFPRFICLSMYMASSLLPLRVLTLVEATASWTLSIMNSLVILREGSSLKRELIRATLAASRLASALLKQHLGRDGEKESLKDSAFTISSPHQWVCGHFYSYVYCHTCYQSPWRSCRFSLSYRAHANVFNCFCLISQSRNVYYESEVLYTLLVSYNKSNNGSYCMLGYLHY